LAQRVMVWAPEILKRIWEGDSRAHSMRVILEHVLHFDMQAIGQFLAKNKP